MDIINNIEWYFSKPKDAINRDTMKEITKEELKTVVFDDSVNENVKICFPLNNDFSFSETRELSRPITVEQLLTFIQQFYSEPLKEENIEKAFENNEEWKEEILERFDGDVNKLTNYHVFEDTCTPDFCGIHLMEEENENKGEYFVGIGPE
jgi:hypothetical protein